MQKWEYTSSPSIGSNLDAMGEDGWEIAAIDGAIMYWKRPKGEPPASPVHDTLAKIERHLEASAHPAVPANRPSGGVEPTNAPKDRPTAGLETSARGVPTDHTAPTRQVDPTPQGHRPPKPGPQADDKAR